jgi:GH25 family lysozyme M1 (1,4-beta-N-acetylmuramidase)
MTEFGIDVSHFNHVDDWHAVRGNNITFTGIKVTESTGFTDQKAAGHVKGARAEGIHVGGYHLARNTDIAHQVTHFAAELKAHNLLTHDSLAPMLDMEVDELRAHANTFVPDFVRRLRKATGVRRVLVYANLDWWRHVLTPADWIDNDIALWIAHYNGNPGHPGWTHPQLALHQHSSKGTVPGIPAHVDRDATIGTHTVASVLVG